MSVSESPEGIISKLKGKCREQDFQNLITEN